MATKKHTLQALALLFVLGTLGQLVVHWQDASAATYGKQAGSSGGSAANAWASAAQAFITSRVSSLTQGHFVKLPPGQLANPGAGGAPSVGVDIQGGGIGVASNSVWQRYTPTVETSLATDQWAIAWRAKYPAPTSGASSYFGWINAAGSRGVWAGTSYGVSTTKFVMTISGSGTTNVVTSLSTDLLLHDFVVTFDGTTITMYIDGNNVGSTTTLSNLTIENMAVGVFSNAAITPGVIAQQFLYDLQVAPFASAEQTCTLPDGSIVTGACIFFDDFSSGTLTSQWIAEDNWSGPINGGANDTCVRHEQATVSGGMLNLLFSANTRASCPQTWTATSYYTTHYGTTWPTGQATHYDDAVVSQRTFNFTYGQVYFRARFVGGSGPGSDTSLWGQSCQGSNGLIDSYLNGFFAHNGPCQFPTTPGSEEMDIPESFPWAGNALNVSTYVGNGLGAPLVACDFYSTCYYGHRNQTPLTGGFGPWYNNPSGLAVSDPTTNFHTYMTDWRPGSVTFYVDGIPYVQNTGAWIPSNPMFLMFSNEFGTNVNGATLPQTEQVDWVVIVGRPDVPWIVNHAANESASPPDSLVT